MHRQALRNCRLENTTVAEKGRTFFIFKLPNNQKLRLQSSLYPKRMQRHPCSCSPINRSTSAVNCSPVLGSTNADATSSQSSLKLVESAEIQICWTGAFGVTTN